MDEEKISVLKDYAVSSLITFAATFFLTLGAQLQSGALSDENLGVSLIISIASIAARAGFKAAIEGIAGMGGSYTLKK